MAAPATVHPLRPETLLIVGLHRTPWGLGKSPFFGPAYKTIHTYGQVRTARGEGGGFCRLNHLSVLIYVLSVRTMAAGVPSGR